MVKGQAFSMYMCCFNARIAPSGQLYLANSGASCYGQHNVRQIYICCCLFISLMLRLVCTTSDSVDGVCNTGMIRTASSMAAKPLNLGATHDADQYNLKGTPHPNRRITAFACGHCMLMTNLESES